MSDDSSNPMNGKAWLAAIGALGFLASLAVALITIVGVFLGVGVWKGGIETRLTAVESAVKDQMATYVTQTEKHILAVETSCKEMITAMETSATRRIDVIERDRAERIQDATRWRADAGAQLSKIETILTNQQRQIDLLTTDRVAPAPTRRN